MKLKVKHLGIKTGGPLIAILNKKDLHELDVIPGGRVNIGKGKNVCTATTNIAIKRNTVAPGEIGVYTEVLEKVRLKKGNYAEVKRAHKPLSIQFIRKKLEGEKLTKKEISTIIQDIINNNLTDVETTYFVAACYKNGLNLDESTSLSQAIVEAGGKLDINAKKIMDKHCIGGVPSNRTTMIIVPILAAAGLIVPKTSTKSITSVAGTADTMEVLAPIKHSKEEIKKIVKKTNACMVWGGTLDLASADDLLIQYEKAMSIDPEGILLASILSKKVSVGATHALIDIPIGKEAKIQTKEEARKLKNKFIKLGKKLKIKVKVMITDGSEPIGNGLGPALEAKDVILVLQNNGPQDLRKKSLKMAAKIMEMAGIKFSKRKAKKILESGKAYEKMKEIIKAQGGNPNIKPESIKLGEFTRKIKAPKTGKLTDISNKRLTRIAKATGAPRDQGSGIYLYRKKGQIVEKGQVLYTIYAETKEKLENAAKIAKNSPGIKIG